VSLVGFEVQLAELSFFSKCFYTAALGSCVYLLFVPKFALINSLVAGGVFSTFLEWLQLPKIYMYVMVTPMHNNINGVPAT
jgi:hypothetical protein